MILSYFAFLGTINLLYNVFNEIRDKEHKDRNNFVMLGISISLLSHISKTIPEILFSIGGLMLLTVLVSMTRQFNEYQIMALNWIMWGFIVINPIMLIWFFSLLAIFIIIQKITTKIFKYDVAIVKKYDIITMSFFLTSLMYGLIW